METKKQAREGCEETLPLTEEEIARLEKEAGYWRNIGDEEAPPELSEE